MLRKLLAKQRIVARRCILVEDTIQNLKAARAVGMRTVWITRYLPSKPALLKPAEYVLQPKLTKRPFFVDVKVKSIRKLSENLGRLR